MHYLVHLTLVSDEITTNVEGDWVDGWDSPAEFLNNYYFAEGGSCVKLNPQSEIDFEDSPFASTELEEDDEPATVPEYGDGPHFISSEKLDDGSYDITYRMCPQIEVTVEAESEQEAQELCQEQGYQLFDIIDVAADEVLGTEMIEILGVREA